MNEAEKTGFAERLKTAASAKQALLAKLKPKTTVTDPLFAERGAMRAAELAEVRKGRAQAKAAVLAARADAAQAVVQAKADDEAAVLDAKRGERKERKALTKVEAKAKRDAKYAARQARR